MKRVGLKSALRAADESASACKSIRLPDIERVPWTLGDVKKTKREGYLSVSGWSDEQMVSLKAHRWKH